VINLDRWESGWEGWRRNAVGIIVVEVEVEEVDEGRGRTSLNK
jgi:hypothetical protein